MLTPVEMQRTLPMTLHGGAVSTTTEVWAMLSACCAGDVARAQELMAQRPELATCQYNYTPPLHFAVREGHLELVRALVDRGAYDPGYKSYPFGDTCRRSRATAASTRSRPCSRARLRAGSPTSGSRPARSTTSRTTSSCDSTARFTTASARTSSGCSRRARARAQRAFVVGRGRAHDAGEEARPRRCSICC